MGRPHRHVGLQSLENKALSWGIIRRSAYILAKITIRKRQDKFAPRKVITIKDEARTVAGCTHDLFKDNFFEDYVDHIRRWASSELGVVIPDPNQVSL
jgi:hypothetical protein